MNILEKLLENPPPGEKSVGSISKSTVRYVDTQNKCVGDIMADGQCKWKNDGIYRWWYVKDGNTYRCTKSKHRDGNSQIPYDTYCLVKQYFSNSEFDVKRYCVHIQSCRHSIVNNIIAMGYLFKGEPTQLRPSPHGNSKYNTNAYTMIKPSIIKDVMELSQTMSVTRAIEMHCSAKGGRIAMKPEERPSKSTIYRKKTKVTSTEDIDTLLAFAKENSGLVRVVKAHPSPILVMATEQHSRDMNRFAQTGTVSIDPTFNLGNFFVTPITYTNTLLTNKRYGNSAVFCGPMLIHFRKNKETYNSFFEEVNKLVGHDQAITCYGTDGELALIEALEETYPMATGLRCTKHFLDNASRHLDNGHAGKQKFQHELKTLLEEPIEAFDDNLTSLISKWPSTAKFLNDHEQIMRYQIHSCNHNQKLFYTNASESVNAKLKRFTSFKHHGLLEFLKLVQEFFVSEVGAAHDGYTGHSETYARSEVTVPGVGSFDWNNISEKERRQILNNLDTVDLNEPENTTTASLPSTDFNISPENCKISCPVNVIKLMFSKADEIVCNGLVMKAPSVDVNMKNYSCCSTSEPTKLYTISIKPTGAAVCQCKHYMLYHICSHTISASHINMTLYDMVMWHRRKFKSRVSSKVLCQTTDTHRSGLKANQTTRKRKSKNTVQESPTIKSTIDCQTDHKSVPRLVYIKNHTTVTKCHICEMDIPTASDLCIGEYVMSRSYRDKSSKKLKMSFKKQWAYSHLQCFDNKREVHICLPIAQNHKSELKRNKITVIGDM